MAGCRRSPRVTRWSEEFGSAGSSLHISGRMWARSCLCKRFFVEVPHQLTQRAQSREGTGNPPRMPLAPRSHDSLELKLLTRRFWGTKGLVLIYALILWDIIQKWMLRMQMHKDAGFPTSFYTSNQHFTWPNNKYKNVFSTKFALKATTSLCCSAQKRHGTVFVVDLSLRLTCCSVCRRLRSGLTWTWRHPDTQHRPAAPSPGERSTVGVYTARWLVSTSGTHSN